MSKITGMAHGAIKVADLDAAVRFWVDGMGMTLRHRAADAAIVAATDGVLLEIFAGGEAVTNHSGFTHLCLTTHDADAAFARALACGATASRGEPYDLGNLRIAFVTAPTGEEVEFWFIAQEGGPRREPVVGHQHIKGFVHAALTVPDRAATVRFYEGLGIQPKVDWGWGCSMKLADGRELELFDGGEPCDNGSGIIHVCFFADDVDATLRQALALGATPHGEPAEWANIRYAFFRGPSGELVELMALLPGQEASFFGTAAPLTEAF